MRLEIYIILADPRILIHATIKCCWLVNWEIYLYKYLIFASLKRNTFNANQKKLYDIPQTTISKSKLKIWEKKMVEFQVGTNTSIKLVWAKLHSELGQGHFQKILCLQLLILISFYKYLELLHLQVRWVNIHIISLTKNVPVVT